MATASQWPRRHEQNRGSQAAFYGLLPVIVIVMIITVMRFISVTIVPVASVITMPSIPKASREQQTDHAQQQRKLHIGPFL